MAEPEKPMKKEEDGYHPADHYLVVEDPEKVTTWHLRVRDVNGELDRRLMGAAWAALTDNYRGNRYEGPNREEALRKLRRLYEAQGWPTPDEEEKSIKSIKIIEEGENTIRVGGYALFWDVRDLQNDVFTRETDLGLKRVPRKPVFYDHALTGIEDELGETVREVIDDVGLWIEAQLKRHKQYIDAIRELIRRGVIGWSPGAPAHLVKRADDGRLLRWPIYEYSLTPIPAQPRTLGVRELKSLSASLNLPELLMNEQTNTTTNTTTTEDKITPVIQNLREHLAAEMQRQLEAVKATFAAESKQQLDALKSAFTTEVQRLGDVLGKAPVPDRAGFATAKESVGAAAVITTRGDTEDKAFLAWLRTGDGGTVTSGVKLMGQRILLVPQGVKGDFLGREGTADQGGYLVPTGHFNQIIGKASEQRLADRLGVRRIPGTGLTVNVPIETEADADFASVAEQTNAYNVTFPRDVPQIGQVAMTLVKYGKDVPLTDELLQDEASNVMAFLEDFVARGIAITHNQLLLTAVATDGTALHTFAANNAIAAGEPQIIVGNDGLAPYLDNDRTVAFVMRSSTHYSILRISGNPFLYLETPAGTPRSLLGYPVFYSQKAAAIGANAKSVYFGNWNYVAYREDPALELLRDPYTIPGALRLRYFFRTVYKVLQGAAVGYGVHPA